MARVGLADLAGVFSRYFVVGFFMPAYLGLVALWLSASKGFVPALLTRHADSTQILILGGVALVVGLLLSGLSYPITRFAEGYPMLRLQSAPVLRLIPRAAVALQRRAFRRLRVACNDVTRPDAQRAKACADLDKSFPNEASEILPTGLGNAMRAYERHSNVRWGLDGVTIWPRIAALLTDAERELLADVEVELRVFLNGAFMAIAVGICLIVDKAVHAPNGPATWPLYAIPFVVAYLLYHSAIGSAVRRGAVVRASFDLHRLEIYARLGVRDPHSFSDERELGVLISQLLLYGRPHLDDALWRREKDDA